MFFWQKNSPVCLSHYHIDVVVSPIIFVTNTDYLTSQMQTELHTKTKERYKLKESSFLHVFGWRCLTIYKIQRNLFWRVTEIYHGNGRKWQVAPQIKGWNKCKTKYLFKKRWLCKVSLQATWPPKRVTVNDRFHCTFLSWGWIKHHITYFSRVIDIYRN